MSKTSILKLATEWSGALRRRLVAQPEFAALISQSSKRPVTPEVIDTWLADASSSESEQLELSAIKIQLRKVRQQVFFTLYLRELTGAASLTEVGEAMSYLADQSVALAYAASYQYLAHRHGTPLDTQTQEPLELLIVAMGKWGGYELNVSSDLDLICIYSEEGQTLSQRPLSHHEFFSRLTQRLCHVLSDLDAYGQVFRCDLRLRPDGDSGPLAWSLSATEQYLVQQGREWERYAWIKARPLNLSRRDTPSNNLSQLIQDFERLRTPFVYRQYFDFTALAALRELRERIRQDWNRRVLARNGHDALHNIKLGEGGIREIEFVVQLNQLIRAGRLPSLRISNLLDAIDAQNRAGVLAPHVCTELKEAYRFLRRVEHLLQYKEDQQTHLLPVDESMRTALAQTMGLTLTKFEQQLQQHRQCVQKRFQDAFRLAGLSDTTPTERASSLPPTPDPLPDNEGLRHYAQQQQEEFLTSQRFKRLSKKSQRRLVQLMPLLVDAAAQHDSAEACLRRLLNVIESIAQRSAYVALLTEYPETLARLSKIVAASPWASQYLAQYPLVLDRLIQWQALMQDIDFEAEALQLRIELDACILADGRPDIEQQMNLMRDTQHQLTFALIAQDLEGLHSVEALADRLSALADLMLTETLARAWPLAHPGLHPAAPLAPPAFAVIAYGKLGGKELGYASDLDLVFLYDEPQPNNQFDATIERYVRLGRRMISWLSTLTSSGRLYEVDMRLRPDGDAGLIAISFEGFAEYQRHQAWSWEHQALTRARFVTGDVSLGARFEALRQDILLQKRDLSTLKHDIKLMRARIRQAHPNRSALFDLKHDAGGMVDVEFITQYLVLAYAHDYPLLLNNLGNLTLLQLAAEYGLIDPSLSLTVREAYRRYRKLQHALRLQAQPWARTDPLPLQSERQAVQALWKTVIER